MQRTISDLFAQSNQQSLDAILPRVKRIRAPIIDVLFPSHSFVVLRSGYGRQIVQADSNVDFGTYARPLVAVNNYVWIEYNDSDGTWHATKYETSPNCSPTTPPHVPNVPFTTAVPPLDTRTMLEPFNIDTNFNPHVNSIGLLAPASKSPPVTGGGTSAKLLMWGVGSVGTGTPIWAEGDLVFSGLHNFSNSVGVFDLSQPSNPAFVSNSWKDTVVGNSIRQVVKHGNICYVMSGQLTFPTVAATFYILDASDPFNMVAMGSFTPGSLGFTIPRFSIIASGTSIYAVMDNSTGVEVWDVTTPTAPVLYTSLATVSGYPKVYATGVPSGPGIYVIDGTTLKIYLLGTPLFLRGSVSLGGGVSPYRLTVISGTQSRTFAQNPESVVYILDTSSNSIITVDATNAASPVIASTVSADSVFDNDPTYNFVLDSIAAGGGYLFVGGDWIDPAPGGTADGILTMFNLKNPLVPVQVDRNVQFNVNDYPKEMLVHDTYVYCVSGATSGLFVFSFT